MCQPKSQSALIFFPTSLAAPQLYIKNCISLMICPTDLSLPSKHFWFLSNQTPHVTACKHNSHQSAPISDNLDGVATFNFPDKSVSCEGGTTNEKQKKSHIFLTVGQSPNKCTTFSSFSLQKLHLFMICKPRDLSLSTVKTLPLTRAQQKNAPFGGTKIFILHQHFQCGGDLFCV